MAPLMNVNEYADFVQMKLQMFCHTQKRLDNQQQRAFILLFPDNLVERSFQLNIFTWIVVCYLLFDLNYTSNH